MKKLLVLLIFIAAAGLHAQAPNYPYTTLIVPQVEIPGATSGQCVKADGTGAGSCGTVAVPNIQITVGTTTIGANACATLATATMTGVTTAMTFRFTPSVDFHTTTGWSAAGATLYFFSYPTANTLNYLVCNNSGASITPGGSTVWNVSAQ